MILITGSDGLLGSWLHYRHKNDAIGFSHRELDVTDELSVLHILRQFQPDTVVNCAGITNKRNVNPVFRHEINAEAPHVLSKVCDMVGIRLIQISTDCVFKGREGGGYTETDEPDADDNYGWTKMLGEVETPPHLTIRTSFVGWPDPKLRGLIAWLRTTSRLDVPGYTEVKWNGLTTLALADTIGMLAYGRETGVMHLYGQTISKHDLLTTVQRVYGTTWGYPRVFPQDDPVLDRTLASVRSDRPIVPGTSNFEEMVWEMKYHEDRFNKVWRESL